MMPVRETVQPQRSREPMQMQSAYTADDFFEEKFTATMSQAEPQSEFNNLLIKALQSVKEVCFAHSVTFFWVKSETRQLVIEGKITDSPAFTSERKLPIGVDIVSVEGIEPRPIHCTTSAVSRLPDFNAQNVPSLSALICPIATSDSRMRSTSSRCAPGKTEHSSSTDCGEADALIRVTRTKNR